MHNVRSAMNVGSMLRTAEGLGVDKVYMTGYTPYPLAEDDERLPHHRQRTASQIHKTALGAEFFVSWQYIADVNECLSRLTDESYLVAALEQTPQAIELNKFKPGQKMALIVGNEVSGLERPILKRVDISIQIPMSGRKESFNVAISAGIAIYHLRYMVKARQ